MIANIFEAQGDYIAQANLPASLSTFRIIFLAHCVVCFNIFCLTVWFVFTFFVHLLQHIQAELQERKTRVRTSKKVGGKSSEGRREEAALLGQAGRHQGLPREEGRTVQNP